MSATQADYDRARDLLTRYRRDTERKLDTVTRGTMPNREEMMAHWQGEIDSLDVALGQLEENRTKTKEAS